MTMYPTDYAFARSWQATEQARQAEIARRQAEWYAEQARSREPVRTDGIEDAKWADVPDVPLLGPPDEG